MKSKIGILVLVSVGILHFSGAVFAASVGLGKVPDCWTESGQDVEDGEFIVGFNNAEFPESKLSEFESLLVEPPVWLRTQIYGSDFSEYVLTTDFNELAGPGMSRDELKTRVNAVLAKIAAFPGVHIECSPLDDPPSMGIH